MRTLLTASLSLALFTACGAQKPSGPPTNDAHASLSLMAGIKAIQKPASGQAVVTFAVFGGPELADQKSLNTAIKPAIKREAGRLLPARSRPYVVAAPNDAKLPLDVAKLAASLGPAAASLASSRFVAFIRYAGPPQAKHRQIRLVLAATAIVANQGQMVVDLSTRKTLTVEDIAAMLKDPNWLSAQVAPGAEQTGDRVTLFSRGMAKLGLPDLEMFNVMPDAARVAFTTFQGVLGAMQQRAQITAGDTIGGVTLAECKRPQEAIEAECVRIP
jgi:hypothetical protein